MSHETEVKRDDHARVTTLLESTHCPKHGMEWEACCLQEVVLELHCKVKDLLATLRREEREAAEKVGRQALAAELLGHLDRITSTTAAFHFVRNTCKIELGQEPDSLGAEIDH